MNTIRLPAARSPSMILSSPTADAENALETSKNMGSEPVVMDISRWVVVVGASATNRATHAYSARSRPHPGLDAPSEQSGPRTNEDRNGISAFLFEWP